MSGSQRLFSLLVESHEQVTGVDKGARRDGSQDHTVDRG